MFLGNVDGKVKIIQNNKVILEEEIFKKMRINNIFIYEEKNKYFTIIFNSPVEKCAKYILSMNENNQFQLKFIKSFKINSKAITFIRYLKDSNNNELLFLGIPFI